jgi:hypothetical protein
MNRFTHRLIKAGAITTVAVGSYTLPALALAAPPSNTVAITAADNQAKADRYAKIEADYRARMRFDEKHAMQYFTLANYWYHKGEKLRMAAADTGAAPRL